MQEGEGSGSNSRGVIFLLLDDPPFTPVRPDYFDLPEDFDPAGDAVVPNLQGLENVAATDILVPNQDGLENVAAAHSLPLKQVPNVHRLEPAPPIMPLKQVPNFDRLEPAPPIMLLFQPSEQVPNQDDLENVAAADILDGLENDPAAEFWVPNQDGLENVAAADILVPNQDGLENIAATNILDDIINVPAAEFWVQVLNHYGVENVAATDILPLGPVANVDGLENVAATEFLEQVFNHYGLVNVAATDMLVPNHDDRENVVAAYILRFEQILSSNLCDAGLVHAIYFNFEPLGYYRINPNAWPDMPKTEFETQLRNLFQTGRISNPYTGAVAWQNITNLSSVLSDLPVNCRKIGCMDGAGPISQGYMNFRDYIRAAPDDQVYVFVVGPTDTQIQTDIDDFVKVSDDALVVSQCLSEVISEMEIKWGIP